MIILGLDISTSITGVAVIEDGVLIQSFSIDTRKKDKFPDVYDVADQIYKELYENVKKVDAIYVEESLKAFASGFSSANTIVKLSKINALACYICIGLYGLKPKPIMATSARSMFDIKFPRKSSSKEKKLIILNWVTENFPEFEYTTTKKGNPKPGTFDRSDAALIAKVGEVLEKSES